MDIAAVHRILKREYARYRMPVVELIEIQTKDPFKVLVATILSSRTRDETTAKAAARLFNRISKLSDLRSVPRKDIEDLIYPVGFYQNKSGFLKKLPDEVDRLFDGRIPETVEELIQLPGVGRKTANLVVAVGFDKPAICVDVHVHRIMNRLGYVCAKTPFDTEMALREKLPVRYWKTINSYMVSFGQHTCAPQRPHCSTCPLETMCPKLGVTPRHL